MTSSPVKLTLISEFAIYSSNQNYQTGYLVETFSTFLRLVATHPRRCARKTRLLVFASVTAYYVVIAENPLPKSRHMSQIPASTGRSKRGQGHIEVKPIFPIC
jgi:hypothetical protein